MHNVIDDLDAYDRLAMITQGFAFKLDVHPSKVSNAEMGTLFEELIRRFMESSKETAGEHFTPREVIRLMVGLLFSADDENLAGQAPMRQVYDPTCGTGGMLSVAEEWITEHAPHVQLTLAGQEQNAETYAIAKADMLIKGHSVDNLVHGDTLTKPGHTGQTFSYCLANPPFGVDWKVQRETVEKERAAGRGRRTVRRRPAPGQRRLDAVPAAPGLQGAPRRPGRRTRGDRAERLPAVHRRRRLRALGDPPAPDRE